MVCQIIQKQSLQLLSENLDFKNEFELVLSLYLALFQILNGFFVRLTPELTQVKSRSHAPGLIVVANFQGLMSLPGTRESILVSAATNTIRTLGNANLSLRA